MTYTLEEAKAVLRVTGEWNDDIIQDICDSLPSLVEVQTGLTNEQQDREPLCTQLYGFLTIQFYNADMTDDGKLQRTIDRLTHVLKAKAEATVIGAHLVSKIITENGIYEATGDGADGYSSVEVDVEPNVIGKAITANGTYRASDEGVDGYDDVVVNIVVTPDVKPLAITANGTYEATDCDGYCTVSVNVPTTPTEDVYKQTLINTIEGQTIDIPEGTIKIKDSMFKGSTFAGTLHIPDSVVEIGNSAFNNCLGLTGDITIPPGVTVISSDVFAGCYKFNGRLTVPPISSIGMRAFSGCTGLTGDVRIGGLDTLTINGYAFTNCGVDNFVIDTLYVPTLSATTAFNGTKVASGTAYIYVPDDLVDAYKVATNWATYANQIRPMSEYSGEVSA